MNAALKMRPQLSVKFAKGDANCFPRSIAEIMGMDHADIRIFLVAEMENNPSEYKCFVENLSEWADAMKEDGTWADGLAVKATANCSNVPIVVFRKKNPDQAPTAFLPHCAMTLRTWSRSVLSLTNLVQVASITVPW